MAYTDKAKLQNYLMICIADGFLAQINAWIEAADRWIDNFTGTTFEKEDTTSKLYDGDGTNEILVDDFTSLTKIEILDREGDVDETLDSSSHWYLYPANKTAKV